MQVIRAFPPNYPALRRAFKLGPTTIFSYGDRVYNPHGVEVSPELMAHEMVHGRAQTRMGVESWWERYIDDVKFRFDEELRAHQAEYLSYVATCPSIEKRRLFLANIAIRLSSPLYGSICGAVEARKLIAGTVGHV